MVTGVVRLPLGNGTNEGKLQSDQQIADGIRTKLASGDVFKLTTITFRRLLVAVSRSMALEIKTWWRLPRGIVVPDMKTVSVSTSSLPAVLARTRLVLVLQTYKLEKAFLSTFCVYHLTKLPIIRRQAAIPEV